MYSLYVYKVFGVVLTNVTTIVCYWQCT